jgi:hypothetical protein
MSIRLATTTIVVQRDHRLAGVAVKHEGIIGGNAPKQRPAKGGWAMATPRQAALQQIVEQEARITRQKILIAHLDAKGISVFAAVCLLWELEDTLTTLRTSLAQLPSQDG